MASLVRFHVAISLSISFQLPDGTRLRDSAEKLRLKYHPIEMDVHMTVEEKLPHMIAWWRSAQELFIAANLTRDSVRGFVHNSALELKVGVREFITELLKTQTPILIFSAGLGILSRS